MLAYAQLYDDRNDYKSSYRWQRLAKAATLHGGLRGWHIACKALAQRATDCIPHRKSTGLWKRDNQEMTLCW